MGKTLKIMNKKITPPVVIFSFVILSIVSYVTLCFYRRTLIKSKQNTVQKILNQKHTQLTDALHKITQTALALARHPETGSLLLHKSTRLLQNKTDFKSQKQIDLYQTFFNKKNEKSFVSDLFLISDTRKIIFALKNKNLMGQDLTHITHKHTPLALSTHLAMMTRSPDISALSQHTSQHMSQQAFFVTVPVENKDRLIGTLALKINAHDFFALFNNTNNLGNTGKILIGTKNRRNKPNGLTLVNKRPIKELDAAAQGATGSGIIRDTHNKKALAAWNYLPGINTGMMVKIDLNEVLKPATRITYGFYFFLFLLFMVAIVWIYKKRDLIPIALSRCVQRLIFFKKPIAHLTLSALLGASIFALFFSRIHYKKNNRLNTS